MKNIFKSIFNTFKEGWEEGKAELAEEQKEEAVNKVSQKENALAVPHEEAFATALAAPFRNIVFGNWFTLFKSTATENEDLYPLPLYRFGDYPEKAKHVKELRKLLKRDFNIVDKSSCLACVASLMNQVDINTENTILSSKEREVENHIYQLKSESPALYTSVISHILTAATDVEYIQKKEAQEILNALSTYVKQHYNSWEAYSEAFLQGEAEAQMNHNLGRNILKKYIGYLNSKKGSPWNNIVWK